MTHKDTLKEIVGSLMSNTNHKDVSDKLTMVIEQKVENKIKEFTKNHKIRIGN